MYKLGGVWNGQRSPYSVVFLLQEDRHDFKSAPRPASFAPIGRLDHGVLAHHGWTWTEEKQIGNDGENHKIYIGPPHPQINIETADGPWTVDFGNPNQTLGRRALLKVPCEGRRHRPDSGQPVQPATARSSMKAVRATINGKDFTFLPGAAPESPNSE